MKTCLSGGSISSTHIVLLHRPKIKKTMLMQINRYLLFICHGVISCIHNSWLFPDSYKRLLLPRYGNWKAETHKGELTDRLQCGCAVVVGWNWLEFPPVPPLRPHAPVWADQTEASPAKANEVLHFARIFFFILRITVHSQMEFIWWNTFFLKSRIAFISVCEVFCYFDHHLLYCEHSQQYPNFSDSL